jgi:hypothetical protein
MITTEVTPFPVPDSVPAQGFVRKWRTRDRAEPARVINNDQMSRLTRAFLEPQWMPSIPYNLFPSDNSYYCPPLAEAKEIIHHSYTYRREYVANSFDCDDFSYVLKAHFCEAAFSGGRKQLPYCFGIVWSQTPQHALNWMINDDLVLRLVEPQKPASEAIVSIENYTDFYLAMM